MPKMVAAWLSRIIAGNKSAVEKEKLVRQYNDRLL
jgi:hypothetical protein